MTTYTYPITATANDALNVTRFIQDLDSDPTYAYTRNLFQVRWNGVDPDFYIDFVLPLSIDEIAQLDTIVAAHAGAPITGYYHYFTYAPQNPPIDGVPVPYFAVPGTPLQYLKASIMEAEIPDISGATQIDIRSIHMFRVINPAFQSVTVTATLYNAAGVGTQLATQTYPPFTDYMTARLFEFTYSVQGDTPYMLCFTYQCTPGNTCIQYGCSVEITPNG